MYYSHKYIYIYIYLSIYLSIEKCAPGMVQMLYVTLCLSLLLTPGPGLLQRSAMALPMPNKESNNISRQVGRRQMNYEILSSGTTTLCPQNACKMRVGCASSACNLNYARGKCYNLANPKLNWPKHVLYFFPCKLSQTRGKSCPRQKENGPNR